MIPIKLSMRNFMCYRDNVPPLHFTGIHTASICGDNGNGKSALVDAITWALWGKTRAKSDDDLIHSGQADTEVEFEFAVDQQTYRVIRKHAKPRSRRTSGRSSLDLLVGNGDRFKVISGDRITQTQQKIINLLHMDYDTFINSAFLRQGHADEFTIANPAKRKQVLADILGLSFYDELEEQAKGLAKNQENERALAESAIKDIGDELAQKPLYEAELNQAQSELSNIDKVIAEHENGLNELRQKKESLEYRRTQLTQLEEHMAEATRTLERWEEQVKQHHSQLKEYEELIAQRASIEEGYVQYIEAKKLSEDLNQKLRLFTTLNERKYKLDLAIVQSSQALLNEHALAQNKISQLETSSQKLPMLKNELQQVQAKLLHLAEEEEILTRKKQDSQRLQTHVHDLESSKTRLEKEIEEIGEKLALLSTQTEAKCPLCETKLGMEGLKLVETKYTTDRQDKSDSLVTKQGELAKQKVELDTFEGEVSRLDSRLNQDRTAAQNKASLLGQEIADAEKATAELTGERSRLGEIEERLARKDFAVSEQQALGQLEGELAKLAYDSQQHEEVRHRLSDLEKYESPKRRLDEANRLHGQEKEALSRAEQAAQELRSSLESDTHKRQELTTELGALPQLTNDLTRAETENQTLKSQQKQAQEIMGSVKAKLERCYELEVRRKEKEKLLSQATKEEKIYRDLAQAFGKTGVQALLIETALPEIEAEANKLLGRMTDNRMHVKIETQRETKKGDVRETLDVNISDELGIRNYEMFSGGEAFRINFAIRIALSKLLAKRTGAPLPTLIIDEGFGTQDNSGLEKVREAITSIQDDFDKIFIITHIEEFRDAFPTRIDVTKTAEGSTLSLN